jgi:hypothetical protein
MNIIRSYPQPDSPNDNIRPRERALAVFKYLLDIEPEQALVHLKYQLIKAAFEQEGIMSTRRWWADICGKEHAISDKDLPKPRPSVAKLINSGQELDFKPRYNDFTPDGL